MKGKERLIGQAIKWIGYQEKQTNAELDSFTANAGSGNYTCFARDYKEHTGVNLQAQPWCAMFVSEVFVQTFGLELAKNLLGGNLYHYCPTGVQQFKNSGRWYNLPEPGAVIFFINGTRANHTGIVIETTSTMIETVEGNTSGTPGMIENGGSVCKKTYRCTYDRILGYGVPNWELIEAKKYGWKKENGGWRFYLGNTGEPIRDNWYQDTDGNWYWFDEAGMMVHDVWYSYKGEWYYFGSDGAMVKGQQVIDGKWYVMDKEGRMITKPVMLIPDKNGALIWRADE